MGGGVGYAAEVAVLPRRGYGIATVNPLAWK